MAVITINPALYNQQLSEKTNRISEQFARFGANNIEVFASEEKHYRQRAEFRVWHEGEDLYHIMFDQQTKQKIPA